MDHKKRKWIDRIYEALCIEREKEAKDIENPYGALEHIESSKSNDLLMAKNIYEHLVKMEMINE